MGRSPESQSGFSIFNDRGSSQSSEDDHLSGLSRDDDELKNNRFAALRQLPVSESQNRPTSTVSNNENYELRLVKPKHKHRLTRPIIAPDTFHTLQTVPEVESESQGLSNSLTTVPVTCTQRYFQLPANQFTNHPLSKASRNIHSVAEQLAKHRDGEFEWALLVRFPIGPTGNSNSTDTPSDTRARVKKAYFGCNLLPAPKQATQDGQMKNIAADTYVLLVTPIDENEEPIKMELRPPGQENTAPTEVRTDSCTPTKPVAAFSENEVEPSTPSSIKTNGEYDDSEAAISPRLPSRRLSRIEDSVEALDKLEEQLEAFDVAAHFHEVTSSEKRKSIIRKSSTQTLNPSSSQNAKPMTPQPRSNSTTSRTGSATVRFSPTTEVFPAPSIRKSVSMTCLKSDSSRTRAEENSSIQGSSYKPRGVTRPGSLYLPKQPVRSTKPPTIPSFELPGEATARRLKEKREARIAMQAAAEQASKAATQAPKLRRAKSARVPTLPTFELPGEAISRRKREAREVQLRAQEEEERRRREFKARPIRSSVVPSSYPRETISSRARQQNKTATAENSSHHSASFSPYKGDAYSNARPPLSSTVNESQPRGRRAEVEPSTISHLNRATSHASSMGSGKRSVLSAEDLEQQRLRGQGIFKKDNSFSEERLREKKERELLAKLAREEAAEKSRQQSREWAAKQARKRITISSLRDLAAKIV